VKRSVTVFLTGGQSQLLKLVLNAAGKRLLSSHRKLAVELTTTQATGGHSTLVSSRTVTFKTPAKHKRTRRG
jgi:hypothetical protein